MSDFSGHDIEDDYFTLRGIEIRTGIKQVDLINSLLGEMLDNGIDYQEAHNVKNPYINIVVSKDIGILTSRLLSSYYLPIISPYDLLCTQQFILGSFGHKE